MNNLVSGPDSAYGAQICRPKFRLNVDELVAIVALAALAVSLIFGATHPAPQVVSCYQAAK